MIECIARDPPEATLDLLRLVREATKEEERHPRAPPPPPAATALRRGLQGARGKATLTATARSGRKRRPMFKLNQETIAVVTVGLALAGLIITSNHGIRSEMQAMRAEARADREAWQAESVRLRAEDRANLEAWQKERDQLRAEDRANLEAWQKERDRLHGEARADREAWQAEARALRAEAGTDREALGRLTGIVEEVRAARIPSS